MLLQAFRTYSQRFIPTAAIVRYINPGLSARVGIPKQARWGILLVLLLAMASLFFAPESVFANNRPAKPTGFTAVPGDQEATLSWDNPGDSSIIRYEFRRAEIIPTISTQSTLQFPVNWTPIPQSGAGTTTYTVTSLANYHVDGQNNKHEIMFHFQVRAVNRATDGTTEQPGTSSDTVTTLVAVPTPDAVPIPAVQLTDPSPAAPSMVVKPSPVPPDEKQAVLDQEGGMPLWLWVTIFIALAAAVIGFVLILAKWRRLSKLS